MHLAILTLALSIMHAGAAAAPWQTLAPGAELGVFRVSNASAHGDSEITILRLDPRRWDLTLAGIGETDAAPGLTAKQWSRKHNLVAATNAGMFAKDYRTHVGYLRFRDHVSSKRINRYQSVAAFDPRREHLPRFRMFDLDAPDVSMTTILQDYASAIQNLRLIKRPGENRWTAQNKKWSEAALGEDRAGRILFIFSRTPFSMHDLNKELLSLDIGLVAAQHLEGGPEAQLYVGLGDLELEMSGSYDTSSFKENNRNMFSWPVPNILGIRPRATAAGSAGF